MPEKILRQIPSTNLFLTGAHFKTTTPSNIEELKKQGITHIFMLFPLTQKQRDQQAGFETRGSDRMSLEQIYAKYNIDIDTVAKLQSNGIRTSSLLRNPSTLRDYESFSREVLSTHGNVLVQCIHGKHASASYAMYHLARHSDLSAEQIIQRLEKAGLTGNDIMRVLDFIEQTKSNIKDIIAHREKSRELKRKLSTQPKKTSEHKQRPRWHR